MLGLMLGLHAGLGLALEFGMGLKYLRISIHF